MAFLIASGGEDGRFGGADSSRIHVDLSIRGWLGEDLSNICWTTIWSDAGPRQCCRIRKYHDTRALCFRWARVLYVLQTGVTPSLI